MNYAIFWSQSDLNRHPLLARQVFYQLNYDKDVFQAIRDNSLGEFFYKLLQLLAFLWKAQALPTGTFLNKLQWHAPVLDRGSFYKTCNFQLIN
jgi:hypothetical protein